MKNRSAPLISVITVVLNGEKTLRRAIESVVHQKSEANIEYIIIDGHSTDASVNIIKSYGDAISFWISEPDAGIYDAWNKGLSHATGEYIAFLGADDFYYPNALRIYSEYIQGHPDVEYISSRVNYVGLHTRVIGKPLIWSRFCRRMTVAHVGSLHRRSLYDRLGEYDTSFKAAGDYEFLVRAGKYIKSGFIDYVSANMSGGGVSTRLALTSLRETFQIKRKYSTCQIQVAVIDFIVDMSKIFLRKFLFSSMKK